MAKRITLVFALLFGAALIVGCERRLQPEAVEVTRVVIETEQVEVTRIVEVAAPTATPDALATGIAEGITATQAAMGEDPTVEPPGSTVTVATLTPTPVGETENKEDETAPTVADTSHESDTEAALAAEETDFDYQEYAGGLIELAGFPEESTPVRWGGGVVQDNTCLTPESCWLVADPGVIGYDHRDDGNADNESAIWHGGANVDNLLENQTGSYTCPEGGYVKVTYPQAEISMPQLVLSIIAHDAEDTNFTFLARCLYAEETEESVDRNIVMNFVTEHPGRVKVMRYPVNPAFAGFFSGEHLQEDIESGHGQLRAGADNCGNSGCGNSYVVMADLNHGTVAVFLHTVENGWELLHSNAIRPTP